MPHALDKWLGISGNWFLLFGGVLLIFTLIQHRGRGRGVLQADAPRPAPVKPEERVFAKS